MRFPRASGVLLHPTSLPGPHGSGDLGPAAYHFVDWLAAGSQRLWQVLPLTGIGAGNSPYSSPSAFGANVLLVDLDELARQGWLDESDLAPAPGFEARRVAYDAVVPWRMQRLALAAARFASSASASQKDEYAAFCRNNAGWLDDHALFMALDEAHPGQLWCDWAPGLAARKPAALAQAAEQHAERAAFWKFCQWSFNRQWAQLRAYAHGKGVRIVGDAPIFVAHHSADAWAHRELFELDRDGRPTVVAGVPPDYFAAQGQRWGNPLYRWSEHAKTGYAWWIARLAHTFETVDIVRIDHFRAFAAHWEIQAGEPTAINGQWKPGPGAALFEAAAKALGELPVIAEDLGTITPDVHALRHQLGFPGMRVLQFAFIGANPQDHHLPHNHAPDGVVYTGTHDNDTAAGWWAGADNGERHFARGYLGTDGHDMPWSLIRAACMSVAATAIHPMQDVLCLPGSARMNHPGQAAGWWEWRFEWSQVHPWHAHRLAEFAKLYDRENG